MKRIIVEPYDEMKIIYVLNATYEYVINTLLCIVT